MMWVLRILTIHYGLPFVLIFFAWKFLPKGGGKRRHYAPSSAYLEESHINGEFP